MLAEFYCPMINLDDSWEERYWYKRESFGVKDEAVDAIRIEEEMDSIAQNRLDDQRKVAHIKVLQGVLNFNCVALDLNGIHLVPVMLQLFSLLLPSKFRTKQVEIFLP